MHMFVFLAKLPSLVSPLKQSRLSVTTWLLSFLLLPGVNSVAFAASDQDLKMYKALGTYGVALVSGITSAAQANSAKDVTGDQVKDSLNQMVSSYKDALQYQKAGIGMLDASFELALATVDISTGGSSLLATSGVRWVKNVAMEGIRNEAEVSGRKLLASNIAKFTKDSGLDYESLSSGKDPVKIKAALDKVGILSDMRMKLGNDTQAIQIIEHATIDAVINTQKSTLDQMAQQGVDIEATKKGLTKLGKEVSAYVAKTEKSLNTMNGRITDVQKSLDEAQTSLNKLRTTTEGNAQQLRAVSGILFSKASASEKMLMLEAGYLKDTLDKDQLQNLTTVIAGEKKKEELVADIGRMVSTFNSIGQIAKNLGVGGDLVSALSTASQVGGVVSSIVSGNYLGAIVSVSGMFGGGAPDPDAQRHAQLMAYLEKRFDAMDKKLDEIIAGQRKIMEMLGKVSEQMALYDAALHDRLDRMEFKLDTIQDMAREILLAPLKACDTVKDNIVRDLRLANGNQLMISTLDKAGTIANAATTGSIVTCVEYLQSLYKHAFDPQDLGLESLAFRFFKTTSGPGTEKQMDDKKKEYFKKTKAQKFYDFYKASQDFVLQSSITTGAGSPNLAHSLSLLSLPAHSAGSFDLKLHKWQAATPSNCSKDTILGETLIGLLCTEPDAALHASRLKLPAVATPDNDGHASVYAGKILRAPMTQDPLIYLADIALFFAPIYDLLDLSAPKVMTTLDEIIAKTGGEAKGTRLLPGALQVVTVGVAQLNLLHGDWTSKLIFDLLWRTDLPKDCKPTPSESCMERFYTAAEISVDPNSLSDAPSQNLVVRRQQAYELLKYNNPYLRRNVLMHALSRTNRLSGDGQGSAYQFGVDSLITNTVNPGAQLATIFGDGIQFATVWEAEDRPAASLGCAEKNLNKTGCVKIPVAQLLGLSIPLPTREEFQGREFIYPPLMNKLLTVQSKLEARLAEYATLEWATHTEADPNAAKARLIQSLLIANH